MKPITLILMLQLSITLVGQTLSANPNFCIEFYSSDKLKTENFLAAVDFYNERIHAPEAEHPIAKVKWETTLSRPLRQNMREIIRRLPGKNLKMSYIGVGNAPLFNIKDPLTREILGSVKELHIYDISQAQLEIGLKKIQTLIEALGVSTTVHPHILDVTSGYASEYFKLLGDAVDHAHSMPELLEILNSKNLISQMQIPEVQNRDLMINADLIYSEMVATFPGIPTNIQFENRVREKFGKSPNFDNSWHGVSKRLHVLFQQFNYRSVQVQAQLMRSMGRSGSIVAIATDIAKIYDDPKYPSLFSLPEDTLPTIDGLIPISISAVHNSRIMWDDSVHETDSSVITPGNHSLQPHKHRVIESVYTIP